MPEQTTPPSEPVRNKHALLLAGQNILTDLLGTIAFVVIFAVTHSIPIAVGFGIASGLGLIGWMKLRRKPIDTMQWLSLFLVVVFGGTALLTRDPIFVKINPTLIYAAVGLIMMRLRWMNRYVPPLAREHAADVNNRFGYVWAALFFGMGAANLALYFASFAVWGWFIFIVPTTAKITLTMLQYAVTTVVVRRRIRALPEPVR